MVTEPAQHPAGQVDRDAIRQRYARYAGVLSIEARDDVPALLAEVDRLTAHSKTLNTLGWRMAEALGEVPAGADQVAGNPEEQLTALLAELEALLAARTEAWRRLRALEATCRCRRGRRGARRDCPLHGEMRMLVDDLEDTEKALSEQIRNNTRMEARAQTAESELERMYHPAYVPPHLLQRVRIARWAQQLHHDVKAAMFLLEPQPPSEARDGLIATIETHLRQIDAETQEGTDGD